MPLESDASTAESAQELRARGWSVVPVHTIVDGRCSCGRDQCPSPGKHPRIRWERYTAELPAVDVVEEWFRRWPDSNVGVVTGAASGVAVIDVDPRHGGDRSLERLAAIWLRLPTTVETLTGGGGRHLWFSSDGPLMSAVLDPGLELKADGAMVVVPPSIHASGQRYRWAPGRSPGDLEPAPLPPQAVLDSHPDRPSGLHHDDSPGRTPQEREQFAEAWGRVGIHLQPGDRYYLCPFHDDHHPSLHIDAEGCRWYCFGCRRGGGIAAVLRMLGEEPPGRRRAKITGRIGETRRITLPGDMERDAVGESLCQDALLELTGGQRSFGGVEVEAVADLLPSSDDPTNVEVRIEGHRVGWMSRPDADRWSSDIADAQDHAGGATCRAVIRGGWDRGGEDVGLFGVTIYLP